MPIRAVDHVLLLKAASLACPADLPLMKMAQEVAPSNPFEFYAQLGGGYGQRKVAEEQRISGLKEGIELFPHQKAAVQKLLDKDGSLLFSHPVGSGKTLSSIAAFEALRDQKKANRALVVVPASLRTNFLDNGVKKFTNAKGAVFGNAQEIAQGTHVSPEHPDKNARYHIVSYDIFRKDPKKYIEAAGADTVIYDELHKIKSEGALTAKSVKEARPYHRNFIGMTGSIVSNTPADVVPLIDAMTDGKHSLGNKTNFESRFISVDPKTGKKVLRNEQVLRGTIAPYVHHVDQQVIAAITKAPSKNIEEVRVEMSPYQTQLYRFVMKELDPITAVKLRMGASKLNGAELNDLFSRLIRLRQLSNSVHTIDAGVPISSTFEHSTKVNKLLDDVEEHLKETPDGQVVIHTNLIKGGVDVLQEGLKQRGIDHALFIGKGNAGVNEKSRQQGVKEYQEGKKKVIVLSAAGGEGLDLPNTTMMAMLDGHYNPERINQAEARGIRAGGQSHRPEDKRNVIVRRYMSVLPTKDAGSIAQRVQDIALAVSPGAILQRLKDPNAPVFINPFAKKKATDEWIYDIAKGKAVLNQGVHKQFNKQASALPVFETQEHFDDWLDKTAGPVWDFVRENPVTTGALAGATWGGLISPVLTSQTKEQKESDPNARLRRTLGAIAGGALGGASYAKLVKTNPAFTGFVATPGGPIPAPLVGAALADIIAKPRGTVSKNLEQVAGHKGPLFTEKQLFERFWGEHGHTLEEGGLDAKIDPVEEKKYVDALREVYTRGVKDPSALRKLREVDKKGLVFSPPKSKALGEYAAAAALGFVPAATAAGVALASKPLAEKLAPWAINKAETSPLFARYLAYKVPELRALDLAGPEFKKTLLTLAKENVPQIAEEIQKTLMHKAKTTALAAVPVGIAGLVGGATTYRELYGDPHATVASKTDARKRSKFKDEDLSRLLRGLPVDEVKLKQHHIK